MTLSRRSHYYRSRPDPYVRVYRLNTKGQSIIDTAINDHHTVGTSIPPVTKHHLYRKICDAGNDWLTPANLNTYVKKRYKEFCATRSTYLSPPISSAASLQTTIEEEEKLFGHISTKTRIHLRWLYQVLNKEDYENLQFWAHQPEYSVTMQEFKGYIAYLERSKVPIFHGLPKGARLKIQGLLRGFPSADQELFNQRAKQIGVDDIAGIAAYTKHLRNVMGLEHNRRSQSPNEHDTTQEVSAAEPKTIPPSSPTSESPSVPASNHGRQSIINAPKLVDTKHLSGPPQSCSPSPTSTVSSETTKIEDEPTCAKKHTEYAPSVATQSKVKEGSAPAPVEDPFRLLDNHPVRRDRNLGDVRRHFRIVPVRSKGTSVEPPQSVARAESLSTDVEGTEYHGPTELDPHKGSSRGANPTSAPFSAVNEGSTASMVHSDERGSVDLQRGQGQNVVEEYGQRSGQVEDERPSPNTTDNYISSDGEDDGELLYPVDDESTDTSETMEIDELDTDDETDELDTDDEPDNLGVSHSTISEPR